MPSTGATMRSIIFPSYGSNTSAKISPLRTSLLISQVLLKNPDTFGLTVTRSSSAKILAIWPLWQLYLIIHIRVKNRNVAETA